MDKKYGNSHSSNFTYTEGIKTWHMGRRYGNVYSILYDTDFSWHTFFGWASYSFSLLSMKSWILFIFSSCWSRRSMMTPMGVFFSPTPSILFSSLFFMLRSLREAWIRITAGKTTERLFSYFLSLHVLSLCRKRLKVTLQMVHSILRNGTKAYFERVLIFTVKLCCKKMF